MQMIFARKKIKKGKSSFSFILDYESDYSLELIYFASNIKKCTQLYSRFAYQFFPF